MTELLMLQARACTGSTPQLYTKVTCFNGACKWCACAYLHLKLVLGNCEGCVKIAPSIIDEQMDWIIVCRQQLFCKAAYRPQVFQVQMLGPNACSGKLFVDPMERQQRELAPWLQARQRT